MQIKEGITIYCDGLCAPGPGGWACWGWAATETRGAWTRQRGYLELEGEFTETEIAQGKGCVGHGVGVNNPTPKGGGFIPGSTRYSVQPRCLGGLQRPDLEHGCS